MEKSIADLMREADRIQRAGAVKYIEKRDSKVPPVNAPYVMKFSHECDYFS